MQRMGKRVQQTDGTGTSPATRATAIRLVVRANVGMLKMGVMTVSIGANMKLDVHLATMLTAMVAAPAFTRRFSSTCWAMVTR